MSPTFAADLPVDTVLPRLLDSLRGVPNAVLSATPGAGKTTRAPLALLDERWLAGRKILMLEPRRLAARRAAEYMAALLHEPVGRTVGYRIRGESNVSSTTRIEIVTEGILTRMLLKDQDLPGVGAVIFDEFHERSIHADLGLALTLDVQAHLRPDLRILVMSATLDGVAVSRLLNDAPVVESEGRTFAVETRYAAFASDKPLELRVADAIARALSAGEGDVLVFLPGIGEIRRCGGRLAAGRLPDDIVVHELYGDGGWRQQLAALAPAPDGRKVILATSIAETSLTIDGVRIVVDSGLARTVRFDPRRGMTGLVTVPASKATADQRRGRAGRQAPGVCYRLWTEREHDELPPYPTPEIKATDLAHLSLDLASWGDPLGTALRFLDPPPVAHLEQARGLLRSLGALDATGRLTAQGRAMSELPIHPRLAHMILRGRELGHGALACDLAAMLEDWGGRTGMNDADIDLRDRLVSFHRGRGNEQAWQDRVVEQSRRLRQLVGVTGEARDEEALGLLLGFAYPDRVSLRKEGTERYQMSGGSTATLPKSSMMARHRYLAVGDVDGAGTEVRIRSAIPLTERDVERIFEGQITESEEVAWSTPDEQVVARRVRMAGALVLSEKPLPVDDERALAALLDGVRSMGLDALPWTRESRSFVERSEWLRSAGHAPTGWPDLSSARLLETLHEWLGPFCGGIWKRAQLSKLNLLDALSSLFTHAQRTALERLAPAMIAVPSGSRIALEYTGSGPTLAVKLQEMFGQTETPGVADGRVKVTVHLLSPARRPLAVTQDLPSFWKNTYPKLRVQMRADYPRHPWPEDPLTAEPTRKTVKRR